MTNDASKNGISLTITPNRPKTSKNVWSHKFTKEELEELQKCAEDPIYFIKNYVKITTLDEGIKNFELWPYQEELIKSFINNRNVVGLLGRQQGKCVFINTLITIRNKRFNNGNKFTCTIGQFYQWQYLRQKLRNMQQQIFSEKETS